MHAGILQINEKNSSSFIILVDTMPMSYLHNTNRIYSASPLVAIFMCEGVQRGHLAKSVVPAIVGCIMGCAIGLMLEHILPIIILPVLAT